MKKQFVKPEIKGIRLRENILAGSGNCGTVTAWNGNDVCNKITASGKDKCPSGVAARERFTFDEAFNF